MAILSRRTKTGKLGKSESGEIEKVTATQAGVTFSFAGMMINLTNAEIDRLHADRKKVAKHPGCYLNNGTILRT